MFGSRIALYFSIFALTLSAAYAAPADYHVTADPAHDAYARSAFLHGHRHGYEEGFHAGDGDLQLGRQPQISSKNFRVPKMIGFDRSYGNKESFRRGYEKGFVAGYSDSYAGREFEHPGELMAPVSQRLKGAEKVTEVAVDPTNNFDVGVLEGYRAAASDSVRFELHPGLAQYAQDFCRHHWVRAGQNEFCEGYGSGYVLGKTDIARKIGPEPDNAIRIAKNQP